MSCLFLRFVYSCDRTRTVILYPAPPPPPSAATNPSPPSMDPRLQRTGVARYHVTATTSRFSQGNYLPWHALACDVPVNLCPGGIIGGFALKNVRATKGIVDSYAGTSGSVALRALYVLCRVMGPRFTRRKANCRVSHTHTSQMFISNLIPKTSSTTERKKVKRSWTEKKNPKKKEDRR
jgi:hypothetical protein